ncbi:MAG: nuclear transport factor 2 family protein [Chloroflexota bacterium]|nr:nuclear transport factor 2 family protein [Chloroflexota bacterium]
MAIDTNRETVERLRTIFESGSLEDMSRQLFDSTAEDFVQDWPQSGERIKGRENAKAVTDNYPQMTGTSPKMNLRRVSGEGAHWVVEGTIDYGDGTPISYVGIAELRDGKVVQITEYFANPFEAPAWRSKWVEKIS